MSHQVVAKVLYKLREVFARVPYNLRGQFDKITFNVFERAKTKTQHMTSMMLRKISKRQSLQIRLCG